jgi:hypothetical protein
MNGRNLAQVVSEEILERQPRKWSRRVVHSAVRGRVR